MFSSTTRSAVSRKFIKRPATRLIVEGLESREVPSFTDGFEGTALDPFWTKTEISGFVTMPSTERAHTGGQSVKFTSTNTASSKNVGLGHTFPAPIFGKASVWVFDTGAGVASSNQFWFSISNSQAGGGALLAAADYGIADGAQYYWDVNGNTAHVIDRTQAWHQFTFDSKPTGLTLQIDGQTVYSDSTPRPFDNLFFKMVAPNWRPAWTSNWDDFEFTEYGNSDLAATALSWPATAGPVNFSYAVNNAALTQSANVGLYWSPGPTFNPATATLAYQTTAQQALGSYGPFQVTPSALSPRPAGATHLLLVLDPAGAVAESNETNNVLAVAIPNGAPDLNALPNQTVGEGATLTVNLAATDPDAGQTLTYSLVSGPAGAAVDPVTGVFTWTPADGPATETVTVRVTDNGSPALGDTESFTVAVNNVAPAATLTGPTSGVRGQERTFTVGAVDPSAADRAAGFTYSIDWGDGTTQAVSGPDGLPVPHTFAAAGTYVVTVAAADKDGDVGPPVAQSVIIQAVELQGDVLVVGGTTADDRILFNPGGQGPSVKGVVNGVPYGPFVGVNSLLAFGQAGNDGIQVAGGLKLPATLDGGDGDDCLMAGKGNAVLRGGSGNDRLRGGAGNDVIDGGAGFLDVLAGGAGDDTLSDPDGVARAAGNGGNDDLTIAFAPDWNWSGSRSLPGGAITGGAGNDVIRVTANHPEMRFDVSGNAGNDRVELSGTWEWVRVSGGAGTDTLKNLGVGLVDPSGIELFE